jgi:hypothetical protein
VVWGKVPESGHAHFNYEYYIQQTVDWFPDKGILAIHTENLWNDMHRVNLMLGAMVIFQNMVQQWHMAVKASSRIARHFQLKEWNDCAVHCTKKYSFMMACYGKHQTWMRPTNASHWTSSFQFVKWNHWRNYVSNNSWSNHQLCSLWLQLSFAICRCCS